MLKKELAIIVIVLFLVISVIPDVIGDTPSFRNTIYVDDDIDDIGWYTSLALDEESFPHISYYDYSNGDLKYAVWTDSSWLIETVDTDENVGRYTSIALDMDNNPHISYYDFTNENLKYAKKTDGAWYIEPVDTRGKVGLYTSITLDNNSYPHISYCDYSKKTLKYAHWTGGSWSKEVVDNSGDMCMYEYFGDYTSIALDSQGTPHISYCDFGNYDLKYAYLTNSGWVTEVVDEDGDVGAYSSLALDEDDNPHISYGFWMKGADLFNLKYAYKTDGVWNIQTVDKDGDVRKWTSLKLDSDEYPHISYHDYTEDALKYTFYDGEKWIKDTVESEGSTGCFSSLCLDSDNLPYISYYDWGNKALKYAYVVDDTWNVKIIEIDTNTDFLDQEQNYCCGYAYGVFEDEPVAQSFIPSYSVLTRVELMIVKRYDPNGFTVSIRDDLEGEDLTSVYLTADEIAEDMSWKNFDFSDIEVTPGQTYYIVCTSEGTEEYNMFWWYYGIYDSYPQGCGWIQTSGWKVLTASGFPDMDLGFKTFGLDTGIPSVPTIDGPTSGEIDVEYEYNFQAVDPSDEDIWYVIEWDETNSGIVGPCSSGETIQVSHKWTKKGNYVIRAKAMDIHGAESDWATLEVSMPKNKVINTHPLILQFFENHPRLSSLLKNLFELGLEG